MPVIGMIWAQTRSGVIGNEGTLPWPQVDGAHFRAVTLNSTVIMGRRTWESLKPQYRPLPHRKNIVLSRTETYQAVGAIVANSLSEAVRICNSRGWVIGGGQVYREAISIADIIEITEVDIDIPGDTFAPKLSEHDDWDLMSTGAWQKHEPSGIMFRVLRYIR